MALTNRQKLFVEHYLRTWNASEAARQAGYKGNFDVVGPRLLVNVGIQERLQSRMRETQLKTDDVLSRLAEQAIANYAEFFHFGEKKDGTTGMLGVNWDVFRARGHLVKKLSWTKNGDPILEFHDAQTALIQIGKALGALKENIEQKTTNEDIEVHLYMPEGRDDHNGD